MCVCVRACLCVCVVSLCDKGRDAKDGKEFIRHEIYAVVSVTCQYCTQR